MSGFAELLPGTHPQTNQVVDAASLRPFSVNGREVFQFGESGPPILALHELPGFTPQFVSFCRALAAAGFTIYAPLLFGRVGESASARNFLRVSMSRDWFVLKDATPRIIGELRRLAGAIHEKHPEARVGAIGMCFTGQLPAAMLELPFIQAAVLSQPSMPFRAKTKLALDAADIEAAQRSRVPMIAFRFDTDNISPPERRASFQKVFGEQIDFQTLRASGKQHAVLTEALFDENGRMRTGVPAFDAFEKTRDYLRKRLSQ